MVEHTYLHRLTWRDMHDFEIASPQKVNQACPCLMFVFFCLGRLPSPYVEVDSF